MYFLRYISMIIFGTTVMVSASDSVVYPCVQSCELSGQTTRVKEYVEQLRCEQSKEGMWEALPAGKEGAYAIRITTGRAEVWANDEQGLYYAKQTISQLMQGVPGSDNAQRDPFPELNTEQVAKLGDLTTGVIIDWPDLTYRGVVEGYYGIPWSAEARQSIFEFMGRNKMNVYIYAPKDDPYHHGRGCYEPYSPEKAQELRQLVQYARKNHVRFVWAVHPANTVRWEVDGGRQQLDALCRKLEAMYELGVRNFGLLIDDTSGEISRAERQVQLSNYLTEQFLRKHPDVNQTLIMCPTGYNRSWATPEDLQTLGKGLDPTTCVMWTGDTVVHDITLEGQRWVSRHLGRPSFIWWNWPCNDFKPNRLSMGRAYGLGTEEEMKEQMSGFVANPMEEAEAGKVALFGVANYTWNIARFDSIRTWEQGIARLYPAQREAMQIFCEHNSSLLPNNHGYEREESTRVAGVVNELMHSLDIEQPNERAARELQKEFSRIQQAGQTLQKSGDALSREIAPWLRQFELLGQAGGYATGALLESDPEKKLPLFLAGVDILNTMSTTERVGWDGHRIIPTNDVEVSMHAMTPALRKTLSYANSSIYALMAGRSHVFPTFSTSCGNADKAAHALRDGNPHTFWSSEKQQQVGDWFCLDFGDPVDIHRANILMGGERANDYVPCGQFEVSDDGEKWMPVGVEVNGPAATINLGEHPVRARMLRFRITQANHNWVSIYEFSVNRMPTAYAVSNMRERPMLRAVEYQDSVGIARMMEVLTLQPEEFIDLQVPALVDPLYVEINLENDEIDSWASVELTTEDGKKVPVCGKADQGVIFIKNPTQQPVRAMRLTNAGHAARSIRLTRFRLGYAVGEGESAVQLLTDQDLTTGISCGEKELQIILPRPPGVSEAIVVGTASCNILGAQEVSSSPHLHHFSLPPGEESLRLTVPQQPSQFINELILK